MRNPERPTAPSTSQRRLSLPVLLFLFMGSGCAALMFELIWLQSLQLVIGSTAVSLGILLATYMGGMCLGGLAAPRVISPKRHPLRVYAALELGIGIIGVAELFLIPLVGRVYSEPPLDTDCPGFCCAAWPAGSVYFPRPS